MSLEPFVAVARAGDVKPGQPRTVIVDGREIALFNVDGSFYAIDNACPHQGAPLAEGWLEGECVVCPMHAYVFELRTGRLLRPRGLCGDQRTFEAVVEGDVVVIYDAFTLTVL